MKDGVGAVELCTPVKFIPGCQRGNLAVDRGEYIPEALRPV